LRRTPRRGIIITAVRCIYADCCFNFVHVAIAEI
jgi:hypothetical protein